MDELDSYVLNTPLARGWRATEIHEVQRDQPNRCRSYRAVDPSGITGFVKLLPPSTADVELMRQHLDEFLYEKAIVELCADRNMRRVVRALAFDKLTVPGIVPVSLHYLIFECGEGDARSLSAQTDAEHLRAVIACLHHVATALFELHFSKIAHQNVRPASVIRFADTSHKLGDFRHASLAGAPRTGAEPLPEATHAAPELLYGLKPETFDLRCAVDNYQLGSLGVALLTGMGATTQFASRLTPMHHWRSWGGSYSEVLPFLQIAHEAMVTSIASAAGFDVPPELIVALRQLTEPDPAHRGHPSNGSSARSRYGLERYVSIFALLLRRLDVGSRRGVA